jgi:predicted metalloprotease with PDZ domain
MNTLNRVDRSDVAVHYRIRPQSPEAHLFDVLLTVTSPSQHGLVLSLPVWIPGSYMIREFSRNIVQIHAVWQNGERSTPVSLEKRDKHTWFIGVPKGFSAAGAKVLVRYSVYAWDLSVRAAHLDTYHGFFNGSCVFLAVQGKEHLPHHVDIAPPIGHEYADWRVFTAMRGGKLADGSVLEPHAFGPYLAANYDELIDHPVEMGCPTVLRFDVCGVPHEIVITGSVINVDTSRLISDVTAICEKQAELFDPVERRLPMDRYVFLILATHDGYGGLEHRASTALLCSRQDFPVLGQAELSDRYQTLLGLISHEYFHTWLVKRIKPTAFIPYDFSQENYTRLLWIFEGFTSYYDDLMLLRSGRINVSAYLKILQKNIHNVTKNTGRLKQSVSDSSFDAWIKYYRQDENSPNAMVSYYAKGALIALGLDIKLRVMSKNVLSLDDVLRGLWRRLGQTAYTSSEQGLAEERGVGSFVAHVRETLEEAVNTQGLSYRMIRGFLRWLDEYLDCYVDGTEDIPFDVLFPEIGLELKPGTVSGRTLPYLGCTTRAVGDVLEIQQVFDGGAIQQAGIASGDKLVALNGIRITPSNFEAVLGRYALGDIVTIHLFRLDVLHSFSIRLQPPQSAPMEISLRSGALLIRDQWLRDC